jgi:hypothetical protein
MSGTSHPRHCEERSDAAIQGRKQKLDCFVAQALLAMTGLMSRRTNHPYHCEQRRDAA